MAKLKSPFTKKWILDTGIPIIKSYQGNLTLRALHYRLVASGMTNDISHYKKVVNTMIEARWEGLVDFNDFKDHERGSMGETLFEETTVADQVSNAKYQIKAWATSYSKNKWENQPIYPEIFIEKKALQGVFEDPCRKWCVALNPCKGYPSLTFLYDAMCRMENAQTLGKKPVILYFGDYDCSGENIPETIVQNLNRMDFHGFELIRVALMEHQVIEWELPPAPTKTTDTRAAKWDGLGQVELDAVEPKKIVELLENALNEIFDQNLYDLLLEQENIERDEFKEILVRDFKSLLD